MENKVSSFQLAMAAGHKVKERQYWLNKLSGYLEKSHFPYDFEWTAPQENHHQMEEVEENFRLSPLLFTRLMNLCKGKNPDVKLHIVLVAALTVLLSKYTGRDDIIIGSPLLNQAVETQFINTVLAFRNQVIEGSCFKDLVLQVRETIIQANINQNYPMETLLEQLNLTKKGDEFPLFDVVIVLENLYDKRFIQHINYNICFMFSRAGDCLDGVVRYNRRLYRVSTVKQIIRHYLEILEQAVDRVETPLSHIQLLSMVEKKQLIADFNNTDSPYQRHETLHRLFVRQVEQNPDRTALAGAKAGTRMRSARFIPGQHYIHLTYNKLAEQNCQLANRLKEKGLQPGSIAALLVDSSLEMIIAVLGVLEAGAAYLPIDSDDPEARIEFMLKDSDADILLTTSREIEKRSRAYERSDGCQLLLVDCQQESSRKNCLPLNSRDNPANLAYIIYTSGTAGNPKGVMTEHRNVSAYLHAFYGEFDIRESDTAIQLASYAFDLFMEELFPVLLRGGKFIIADVLDRLDVNALSRAIALHGVTIVDCTPLQLDELNRLAATPPGYNLVKTVHTFISGGDVLRKAHVGNLLKTAKVYNTYGPTETTVCATYHLCNPSGSDTRSIPIGKPIRNYQTYILDKNLQILPLGVSGELCLGGDGVARGYLNNPGLTAEKFINQQFERTNDNTRNYNVDYPPSLLAKNNKKLLRGGQGDGFLENSPPDRRRQKLYKTGDLGRWLPDGNIEFLGRIDSQVKLRGFRIELAEIERRLSAHPGIKGGVVQVLSWAAENEDKYLCAYFTADKEIPDAELREFLSHRLPGYMIPSYFVFLQRIPLTANGKVDRQALPLPGLKAGGLRTPPRNEIEKKLAALWIEALGRDARHVSHLETALGIDDNFFELGGHSLKAVGVISRVNNEFKVDVPLAEFFKAPYIRKLALDIQQAGDKISTAPAADNTDLNLVLLRENPGPLGNLFFIHDGTGEVEGYIELCVQLGAGYNYWGVRANRLGNYTPQKVSIEEIAAEYIEKINALQPSGPYHLAGWSIGGVVAFEIALQLEKRGEAVSFLGLIDAPPPPHKHNKTGEEFQRESEIQWIKEYFPDEEILEKLNQLSQIHEIWPVIVRHMEENRYDIKRIKRLKYGHLVQLIPNYHQLSIKELIAYLSVYRTLTRAQALYIPSTKIHTPLTYFKAGESPPAYRDRWQEHCIRSITTFEIPGDHFSILKIPDVYLMKKVFQEIFEE